MALASHFVIEEICNSLKEQDITQSKELFDKLYQRYLDDIELKKIYTDFKNGFKIKVKSKNQKNLTLTLKSLEELINSRKFMEHNESNKTRLERLLLMASKDSKIPYLFYFYR